MAKYSIQKFNNISEKGLSIISDYEIGEETSSPDAIVLRSQNLHDYDFADSVLAVGRAGAGVNNIPVEQLSDQGVIVFNTPGANANAVKELVISGMLIAARNLFKAHDFVKTLEGDDQSINQATESSKKTFAGFELKGKTLGVVGLGAIGVMVANTARDLGMNVIGYDPSITIKNAWQLSSEVEKAEDVNQVYSYADFLSFHVPLNEHTQNLFSSNALRFLKSGVCILNFSRGGIVDPQAILEGIEQDKIKVYCTDFPQKAFLDCPQVVVLPHLGASTKEAEENCAVMVCQQIKDYLEKGNISNSVNFPEVVQPRSPETYRLTIVNRNIPNMLAEISGKLGENSINIVDMINKSKGDYAYTLVDTANDISDQVISDIQSVEGIIKVRKVAD